MPAKKTNTNAKTTKMNTESVSTPAQVLESTPAQVLASVPEVSGGKPKTKRGKKVIEVPVTVVESPAVETKANVSAPTTVSLGDSAPKLKGGRKKVTKVPDSVETKTVAPVVKKTRAKKAVTSATTETTDVTANVTEATENALDEKHIRSFKVLLPGYENFEGRFTGLTPYQAANKALSKYFREGERSNAEVTFSICESTRKSKKSVYTYVGQRHKLESPVRYTIQGGREIVKQFKNTLKKVKKSDNDKMETTQQVSATASA